MEIKPEQPQKQKKSGNTFFTLLEQWIPSYTRLPLVLVVVINFSVYWGSRLLAAGKPHLNMETELDQLIPLVPWTVLIYFGCYIFWIANYILAGHTQKEQALRFYAADILAKLVCLFFYVVFPTTMPRPEITGNGISEQLMLWLYRADASDNLFPSIHCLVSWLCYIGVRKQAHIPKSYRALSCFFAILVFISTVTTRQHVIADVLAGIVLAEASYGITGMCVDYYKKRKKSDTPETSGDLSKK